MKKKFEGYGAVFYEKITLRKLKDKRVAEHDCEKFNGEKNCKGGVYSIIVRKFGVMKA